MRINADKYICKECDFKCSKLSNYNKHLSTRKHLILTNTSNVLTQKNSKFVCDCGKTYNHRQSLHTHKKKCNFEQDASSGENNTPKDDERDKLINILFKEKKEMMEEKKEMKDLVLLLVKNLQEVIPHLGTNNTIGDHNNLTNSQNTLNFYLTNTCKDAESITEFTARFCERIETFFNGNYHKIATNQSDLSKDVQDLFFECLEDKPQMHKFIQTTDTKNGVYYVKEPNKLEEKLTYGDSEFVKYKDGFERPGARIGHAINQTLQPCKMECLQQLENTLVTNPKEEDYDDYEEFEKADDSYRKSTGTVKENLMFQTHNAMCLFDNKKVTDKVLTGTKRPV
jgi:hypothetical protein